MSLQTKVVSSVKWNTIFIGYNYCIQFIQLPLLARLLEKSDFGLVAIAYMVIGIIDVFSDFGIVVGVIHKQNISDSQYSSLFWFNLICSFVLYALLFAITPIMANFYDENILNTIIPLLGLTIIFNGFGKLPQTKRIKQLDFKLISIVSSISISIGFVVTLLLALCDYGVYSLIIGRIVQAFFLQLTFTVMEFCEQKISFHLNFLEIGDFMRIGSYQLGSRLLDFASSRIDIILIGHFWGMSSLGVYNLAKDLTYKPYQVINSLVSSISSSMFAKLQDNVDIVRIKFVEFLNYVTLFSFPIYMMLFSFSDLVVSILYGSRFEDAAAFVRILSIVGMCNSICSASSSIQIAFGRTDIGFKWTCYNSFFSLVCIAFASCFSMYVIAYSQLVLTLILLYVYWRIVVKELLYLDFLDYVKSFRKNLFISFVVFLPFILLVYFIVLNVYLGTCLLVLSLCLYLLTQYRLNRKSFLSLYYLFSKKKK